MSRIIIKNALIIQPGNELHRQQRSILVDEGQIKEISEKIDHSESVEIIEGENLHVSIGFFDMSCRIPDPGHEFREDFETGTRTAAAAGFTAIGLLPSTDPCVDTKSKVSYVTRHSGLNGVEIIPYATISKNREGNEITEFYDLTSSGVKAFTDDQPFSPDSTILLNALKYSQLTDSLIIAHPGNYSFLEEGMMNESEISLRMGLKGIPDLAESSELVKMIEVNRYASGKFHFSGISSKRTIELLNSIPQTQCTAECGIHHLSFSDEDLKNYNTNLKMLPVIRTNEDRKALREAVIKNQIQVISSYHTPIEDDLKKCEFQNAAYGASALQAFLPQVLSSFNYEDVCDSVIEAFTSKPRTILNIDSPTITVGATANLTIWSPEEKWTLNEESNFSRSTNHPLWGKELKGKIIATINGDSFNSSTNN